MGLRPGILAICRLSCCIALCSPRGSACPRRPRDRLLPPRDRIPFRCGASVCAGEDRIPPTSGCPRGLLAQARRAAPPSSCGRSISARSPLRSARVLRRVLRLSARCLRCSGPPPCEDTTAPEQRHGLGRPRLSAVAGGCAREHLLDRHSASRAAGARRLSASRVALRRRSLAAAESRHLHGRRGLSQAADYSALRQGRRGGRGLRRTPRILAQPRRCPKPHARERSRYAGRRSCDSTTRLPRSARLTRAVPHGMRRARGCLPRFRAPTASTFSPCRRRCERRALPGSEALPVERATRNAVWSRGEQPARALARRGVRRGDRGRASFRDLRGCRAHRARAR